MPSIGDAQAKALDQTLIEIQKAQNNLKLGRYTGARFNRELVEDKEIDKQAEQKLLRIDRIIGQQGPLNYQALAAEMDAKQIAQYVNTALTPGFACS